MEYKRLQRELSGARDEIGKLKSRHDAELRKLAGQIVERQEKEFLQSKFITDYKIEGIGVGRAATLASYGIETAWDVEYNRVLVVPGMGPHFTNVLCAWRTQMLRGFKPDRARGVPLAERQALLLKYVQMRQQLEIRLRRGPQLLRNLHAAIEASVAQMTTQLDYAQVAVAQAQADLDVMERPDRAQRHALRDD